MGLNNITCNLVIILIRSSAGDRDAKVIKKNNINSLLGNVFIRKSYAMPASPKRSNDGGGRGGEPWYHADEEMKGMAGFWFILVL